MNAKARARAEAMMAVDNEVTHIVAKTISGAIAAQVARINVKGHSRIWLLCPGWGTPEDRRLIVGRKNAIAWLKGQKAEGTDLKHSRRAPITGPIPIGHGRVFINAPDGFLRLVDKATAKEIDYHEVLTVVGTEDDD